MLKRILLSLALGVATTTAVSAQSNTHLNVPAKQVVSIQFVKAPGDAPGQFSNFYLHRPNNTTAAVNFVPAGYALVIRDLYTSISLGPTAGPAPVIVSLVRTDANLTGIYGDWTANFTLPGAYNFQTFHMSNETGMAIAPPARPSIYVSMTTLPQASLDSVAINGWGYLVAY